MNIPINDEFTFIGGTRDKQRIKVPYARRCLCFPIYDTKSRAVWSEEGAPSKSDIEMKTELYILELIEHSLVYKLDGLSRKTVIGMLVDGYAKQKATVHE